MANPTYDTSVYFDQNGDELVIDQGGYLTVKGGGAINVLAGATVTGLSGGGGGGTPGGSPGQLQYNNSGAFAGLTVSGDGTLDASTGALAVTKTGGVAFAASATVDATNASNIASGTLPAARLPASGAAAGTYNNVTVTAQGLVAAGSNAAYLTANQAVTLSGDASGSGATAIAVSVARVNGVSYGASPATNTVPVVTGANAVTYAQVPNAALANSAVTVTPGTGLSGGGPIALGGSATLSLATIGGFLAAGTNVTLTGAGTTASPYTVAAATSANAAKASIVAGLSTASQYSPPVVMQYSGTITKATMQGLNSSNVLTSGSAVMDVLRNGSSIAAGDKPTLSSASSSTDTALTGWTTAFAAGDVFQFLLNSISTIATAQCTLSVTKS